ncbi:MAG: hypothetical protein RJB43_777, partial [Verrucomicrobiota bacterium]
RLSLADRRLLVVDDNATNRRILTDLAGRWGMHVRAAASGAEALGWLRAGEIETVRGAGLPADLDQKAAP